MSWDLSMEKIMAWWVRNAGWILLGYAIIWFVGLVSGCLLVIHFVKKYW